MTLEREVDQVDTEEESFDDALYAMEKKLGADGAEGDETEAEAGEGPGEQQDADADIEVSIGFDDDPAPEEDRGSETDAFRNLRAHAKRLERRVRELEAKPQATAEATYAEDDIGPEPTLAECDYDEDAYKTKLLDWNGRKAVADKRKADREEQGRKQIEAYQVKRQAYHAAAASLGVKDFEDAEAHAKDIFSNVQQSILVKHATNPAALVYALGNTEAGRKKAKDLAAIADPIEFALAAAKLEDKHLKVTNRKPAPPPERQIRGSGKTQAVTSANLDALQKKARETGDYTAYYAAKRQKEAKT